MGGNPTIRAFGTHQFAMDRKIELQEEFNLVNEMSIAGFIWFSIQMRMSASVLMFAAGVLCALNRST